MSLLPRLVVWYVFVAIQLCWSRMHHCNEARWSSVKNVCADCLVLAGDFQKYGTCEEYCRNNGERCVAAFDEKYDQCIFKKTYACNESIHSSDALCECRSFPTRFTRCDGLGQQSCGPCEVLLDEDGWTVGESCATHCKSNGLTCLGAFKVANGSCTKTHALDCDVTHEADRLCKCVDTPPGLRGELIWHITPNDLMSNGPHEKQFQRWEGTNCYEYAGGAIDIDNDASAPIGLTVSECASRCSAWNGCDGFVYLKAPFRDVSIGKCWMRKAIQERYTCRPGDTFDTYKVVPRVDSGGLPPFPREPHPPGMPLGEQVDIACMVIAVVACFYLLKRWCQRVCRYHDSDRDSLMCDLTESESSASDIELNLHYVVPPERWCVDVAQLSAFGQALDVLFPEYDPDGYKVVEDFIKPLTKNCRTSYSLKLNTSGKQVTHFVTHAWAEGVKEFVASVKASCTKDSVFWICFLANPQTWPSDELSALLGANPYLSPFFAAVRDCKKIIAVRNDRVNMCERLWCVFELFEASKMNKPIVAVGRNPATIDLSRVGVRATCSNDRDTKMLRKAIHLTGQEDDVNKYVELVLQADAPNFLP
eukprot:TRINITY_DN9945_c0_g1_i2.p1 TRINITY_DN9945_c0_g1~~TRINITY_DN9945_c0_g1_i2.p1  ORF type:complete len:591 (-),score=40.89 TRINITY_DN9945_c0_g1_i2:142-1914(-)